MLELKVINYLRVDEGILDGYADQIIVPVSMTKDLEILKENSIHLELDKYSMTIQINVMDNDTHHGRVIVLGNANWVKELACLLKDTANKFAKVCVLNYLRPENFPDNAREQMMVPANIEPVLQDLMNREVYLKLDQTGMMGGIHIMRNGVTIDFVRLYSENPSIWEASIIQKLRDLQEFLSA